MEVDELVVFHRELDRLVDGLLAELARELVVRDAADTVRAEPQTLLDELRAVRVGVHALLRERDDLDRHDVSELLAQLEERLERREARIRHIGMRADELHARAHLLAHGLTRAPLDLLAARARLRLAPALDALEERARAVRRALAARRVDVVEMEMRIDVGRHDEAAAEVDGLRRVRLDARRDGREFPLIDEEILRLLRVDERGMAIKFLHDDSFFLYDVLVLGMSAAEGTGGLSAANPGMSRGAPRKPSASPRGKADSHEERPSFSL